jgi:sortase A
MNMYGQVFTYEVTDKSSINPRDFDSLNAGDWNIALVTCTAGGRMRMAIKCVAIGSGSLTSAPA